jgi:hypothetical protein
MCRVTLQEWKVPEVSTCLKVEPRGRLLVELGCFEGVTKHKINMLITKIPVIPNGYLVVTCQVSQEFSYK